jgi:hypothetical protein
LDNSTDVASIRSEFEKLGCPSEGTGTGCFSMEIPAKVDYLPIKEKLKRLEEMGILEFSEPCLSSNHAY